MYEQLQQLLISLALGLLVGLQRERAATRLAGLRTFGLVTLLGTLAAQLAAAFGPYLVAVGLLGVIATAVMGNFVAAKNGGADPGQTTELAMLMMYLVGAFVAHGPLPLAVALGAGVAVLLHLKPALQGLVARIGDVDFRAIMNFVVVSLVVLPVLPDRTFGPYQVLNPREVWLMVVLIVGIGLAGYLAHKLFGTRGGSLLGGLLGGLISSTATTVTFARRSRTAEGVAGPAAAVILLASAVAFARILVEIGVVARGFFRTAVLPLGGLTLLFLAVALLSWLRQAGPDQEMPEPKNPSELKGALVFAALYAGILLAVAAARDYLGSGGLYAVAVVSGLTDVDAITLSTANLVRDGGLEAATGWRIVMIAALSNLAFKAGAVALLGHRALLARIALGYGVVLLTGVALLVLWP
jgi:uncharacterized membrane protein (DUF4010 family)